MRRCEVLSISASVRLQLGSQMEDFVRDEDVQERERKKRQTLGSSPDRRCKWVEETARLNDNNHRNPNNGPFFGEGDGSAGGE